MSNLPGKPTNALVRDFIASAWIRGVSLATMGRDIVGHEQTDAIIQELIKRGKIDIEVAHVLTETIINLAKEYSGHGHERKG